jgi:aldose 1-epimerase
MSNKHGQFYQLENEYLKIVFCDIGASVVQLWVPDQDGIRRDVVLGYPEPNDYDRFGSYLGSTIGRVANRIKDGKFVLNGQEYQLDINNGPNHLHGGLQALHLKQFKVLVEQEQITFSTMMLDQESGYPGNVEVTVRYQLEGKALRIDLMAISDQDTLCNLTNHSYFNLNGEQSGSMVNHQLMIEADEYVPINEVGIPVGIIAVDDVFDLRQPRMIKDLLGGNHPQLIFGNGLDHGYKLRKHGKAVLVGDQSGITMTLTTSQPGIHVYTGNYLEGSLAKHGVYHNHDGIALEAQVFADAVNQQDLGNVVLRANEVYHQTIKFEFGVE